MTTHHQQGWGGTQPKARVEMLSASRILHPSLSISTKAGFLAKQANNTRLGPPTCTRIWKAGSIISQGNRREGDMTSPQETVWGAGLSRMAGTLSG